MKNGAYKVGFGASMMVVSFRCLMALHGTVPSFGQKSLSSFVLFCVAPIQFNFDWKTGETKPALHRDKLHKIIKFLESMCAMSILLSFLMPYSYRLFPQSFWGNMCNNYVMAYLTGRSLESGTLAVGIMTEFLTGISVMELSNSPLTASRSPSDFWGRRWNSLVHGLLKVCTYVDH